MFSFLKSKSTEKKPESTKEKISWKDKLRLGLKKTRNNLSGGISNLFLGKKVIDKKLLDELETILLGADIGVTASETILANLTEKVGRKELADSQALFSCLKKELITVLKPCEQTLNINSQPFVILMVGVNGVGKTTSIAKIAHFYQNQNKKIMLAAGDTFRAAAVEQLQTWGERNSIPVISQRSGSDSASVIYDALQSSLAKDYDLLIADTAGRLHTQDHLMAELQKIKRVMGKLKEEAPHEVMLVIDAGTGQNALNQAQQFHQAIGLTGLCITKLDGTAKGGVIIAIADKMKLPIRFIGVGEDINDLKPFVAEEFVDALFI